MRVLCCLCVQLFLLSANVLHAQQTTGIKTTPCGTMKRLELKFQRNPELRNRFSSQTEAFNKSMTHAGAKFDETEGVTAVNVIPIVFHIVLPNPNVVTDAQIKAQLDTLNKDFFGTNGDSVKIPSYFKSLFGKSSIQFCLAQKTPAGDFTTGIHRITTTKSSFGIDDGVKHTATKGVASWNTEKYFNVWITALSDDLLGYATFPNDGSPDEQGVVMDYRSLPGGSYSSYNGGKTLTHETGHFFNLYHIWGDDDGACNGSDFVGDTPNQSDATSDCYSGVHTDKCTPSGNGIMYQNFMDYSPDACLVMFTPGQVSRMQTALSTYRASLLTSTACQSPVINNYDVQVTAIPQPAQRICAPSFIPVFTLKNNGSQTVQTLQVTVTVDNQTVLTYNWTGTLTYNSTTSVTLPSIIATEGVHTLSVTVSQPNGQEDEVPQNNKLETSFQYYASVTRVTESFETTAFPTAGWDIVNPDKSTTWQKVTGVGKTGTASVMLNNFASEEVGQKDDLRLPFIQIPLGIDSAFLSFQVAAATHNPIGSAFKAWDTLEVLVSTDCGTNYSSLYKKWGSSLITRTTASSNAFTPAATEWRKDSINLASYIGQGNLLIAFRNTTGIENNIYLDDINLRTVTVNPNLKRQGFMVTPSPTSGFIAVQFYPQPTNLQRIQILTSTGQLVKEIIAKNGGDNYYGIDLSEKADGIYIVRALFTDTVLIKKIVKQ